LVPYLKFQQHLFTVILETFEIEGYFFTEDLKLASLQFYGLCHCHKLLQVPGLEVSISFLLRINLHEQRE
jgi:hypothetical protein